MQLDKFIDDDDFEEEKEIKMNRRSGITRGTNEDLPLSGNNTPTPDQL